MVPHGEGQPRLFPGEIDAPLARQQPNEVVACVSSRMEYRSHAIAVRRVEVDAGFH